MNTIKKIIYLLNTKFNDILLRFLGITLLSAFIWVRFIRERLPRDIPFQLSIIGFIALLTICCTYFYLIYKIFKPNTHSNYIAYFYPLLKFFANTLKELNHMIVSNKVCLIILRKFLFSLQTLFKPMLKIRAYEFLYIFVFILPKVLMVFCIIVDCFYLSKLYFTYNCIAVVTFPLIVRYLLYLLPTIQKHDTELLDKHFMIEITSKDFIYKEDDYDEEGFLKDHLPRHLFDPSGLDYYRFYADFDDIGPYMNLPKYNYFKTEQFIDYQSSASNGLYILYEYRILFHDEREDTPTAKNIPRDTSFSKENCKKIIECYIALVILQEELFGQNTINFYKKTFQWHRVQVIDLILTIILLGCWVYILIKSVHTLPNNLAWIKEYLLICNKMLMRTIRIPISLLFFKVTLISSIAIIHYLHSKHK